ncbi:MAG: hypothetical protein KA479_10925 [Saprospiraceae bacterium]|nr:hypothetical protein [Saprospiraceae bacterium]
MRYHFTFLLIIAVTGLASSQMDTYTYVSDRRFNDPTDLLGWQFRPAELEIPKVSKSALLPGDYRFGVTQNNLFVEGPDIAGVYSINNINPSEYGYILNLMNARNPTLQGHLKVILNKNRQADAVIFKRSPKEPEMVFWLPLMSERDYQSDGNWFTDRKELFLPHVDSLWGQDIHPFLLLDKSTGKQQRLIVDDSTYLHFSREIARNMKDKKKRKKGEVSLVDSLQLTIDDLLADSVLLEQSGVIIEERIADFVRFKTRIFYEDGGSKWIEELLEIKRVTERADRKATDDEEKYLWEIELKNGERINVYLDTQRYVSTIEWGARWYLMRGF